MLWKDIGLAFPERSEGTLRARIRRYHRLRLLRRRNDSEHERSCCSVGDGLIVLEKNCCSEKCLFFARALHHATSFLKSPAYIT
jgi:hypothetical protein